MTPAEVSGLVAEVVARAGPTTRAVVGFGSCFTPGLARAGSIPDLFVLVDDVRGAMARLGAGRLARAAAAHLPPATLSLSGRAKLNLVEPRAAGRAIAALDDLYLAGRFSKRTIVLFSRTPEDAEEVARLVDAAARVMCALACLGLPRRAPLDDAVLAALGLSYRAELRPEPRARVGRLFAADADGYRARLMPLVREAAVAIGFVVDNGELVDRRPPACRAAGREWLARVLRRGRRRAMARWPKQALLYRGWIGYVAGKIVASRRGQASRAEAIGGATGCSRG